VATRCVTVLGCAWVVVALVVGCRGGHQGKMTPALFRDLVESPPDGVALRPELAKLPLWPEATIESTLTYADGRVVRERCRATSKTLRGEYVVFGVDSELYGQRVYSVLGYDVAAKVYRQWSLYDGQLVESTLAFDLAKGTSSAQARYGDGFTETSAGEFNSAGSSELARTYKGGALVLTRESKTTPLAPASASTKPAPK